MKSKNTVQTEEIRSERKCSLDKAFVGHEGGGGIGSMFALHGVSGGRGGVCYWLYFCMLCILRSRHTVHREATKMLLGLAPIPESVIQNCKVDVDHHKSLIATTK